MIENNTCNGNCSRCGECCMPSVPITLEEYITIKEYIEKNEIKSQEPFENGALYMMCPFFDRKNHKCTIYEVRPEVCKNFICNANMKKIDKDRTYYDSRADINGNHTDRYVPFDLLFHGSPVLVLMDLSNDKRAFNIKSEKELISFLKWLGRDQEFFKKNNINNTYEVAQAIEEGKIELEWEDE